MPLKKKTLIRNQKAYIRENFKSKQHPLSPQALAYEHCKEGKTKQTKKKLGNV